MTYYEVFQIIVGEGGFGIDEFWYIDDVYLLEGVMKGIARRYRSGWEQAKMLACTQSKKAADITFPWEKESYIDQMSDSEREAEMEAAKPRLMEALQRSIENDIKHNGKETSQSRDSS